MILFILISYSLEASIEKPDIKRSQHPETCPYLWVYWEMLNGTTTMPAYISLCRKTLLKHCNTSFNIVELNEKNIHHYLPELKSIEIELNLDRLSIAQKVDLYRVLLLHKYGGIYIDSDMIVMKNLQEITNRLRDYDYVGFGQYNHAKLSYNSYGAPQNWIMASRKKGILITKLLENMINILKVTNRQNTEMVQPLITPTKSQMLLYHSLGKYLIKSTLQSFSRVNYHYYHYSADYDGTRDVLGEIVSMNRIFSPEKINYKDPKKFLVVALYNYYISRMPGRKNMSEQELLNEDTNFSTLVKQSLGLK